MYELTIKDTTYQFHFGLGFLREVNRLVSIPVDEIPGVTKNIGLRYNIALLYDRDIETLVDILLLANKGQTPRITNKQLEEYLEEETTDIGEVFDGVLDFLKTSNVTKVTVIPVIEAIEAEIEKRKNQ